MTTPLLLALELLPGADDSLVRTVDALTPEDLAAPSLLPGWTRGHVVAHVALNAEGLGRVLAGLHRGRRTTMYDSQEARDADIAELGTAEAGELRDRMLAATHGFSQAVAAMGEDDWHGVFERTPGGQQVPVARVPVMRLREVEIHHADLGSGYAASDWPAAFVVLLIDSAKTYPHPEPFRVHARDLDREWSFGDGEKGPLVTGDAAALGWWLTGRGSGDGLECDSDSFPRIAAW